MALRDSAGRFVRLQDRDRGYNRLLQTVERLGKEAARRVLVGIQGAEAAAPHHGTELTTAEVGAIHEFGLGNCPERSFLRSTFDVNRDAYLDLLRRMGQQIVKGAMTPAQALELLGQKFVGDIQGRIAEGIDPPLAPSTIAAKGSSTPLIDTGQLRSSITYKVE